MLLNTAVKHNCCYFSTVHTLHILLLSNCQYKQILNHPWQNFTETWPLRTTQTSCLHLICYWGHTDIILSVIKQSEVVPWTRSVSEIVALNTLSPSFIWFFWTRGRAGQEKKHYRCDMPRREQLHLTTAYRKKNFNHLKWQVNIIHISLQAFNITGHRVLSI